MIIKKNEETIKNFIEKYSSYDELGSLLRKYEIKFNELMKNGEPSEFEKKKFDIEFNKQVREVQEENAPKKEELKRLLMTFSQELLLELYNRIENNEVRELIYYQIAKNSGVFYNINIDAETGAIFEKLDNIPLENKQDLLEIKDLPQKLVEDGQFFLPDLVSRMSTLISNITASYGQPPVVTPPFLAPMSR